MADQGRLGGLGEYVEWYPRFPRHPLTVFPRVDAKAHSDGEVDGDGGKEPRDAMWAVSESQTVAP